MGAEPPPVERTPSLPHEVQVIEHTFIPMPDGTRLAARIWLPEGAEQEPVPAILEDLPYRLRDGTRLRDEVTHGYFAGHGYGAVRVQHSALEPDGLKGAGGEAAASAACVETGKGQRGPGDPDRAG